LESQQWFLLEPQQQQPWVFLEQQQWVLLELFFLEQMPQHHDDLGMMHETHYESQHETPFVLEQMQQRQFFLEQMQQHHNDDLGTQHETPYETQHSLAPFGAAQEDLGTQHGTQHETPRQYDPNYEAQHDQEQKEQA
jgi:hypothetical protein